MYRRPMYLTLVKRLKEPRRVIQVLTGAAGSGDGIPLEKFLLTPAVNWVSKLFA